MAFAFRAFRQALHQKPILTNCCTCGVLVGAGDIISQKLIEKQPRLNVSRTAKFAVFGLLYVGPATSLWFRFLERPFGVKKIFLKPWQKVGIDQSFFAPQINLYALPVLGLLNNQGLAEIKENIKSNYIDIVIASYKIWPAVQIVNFYLVPASYRPIFVYAFSLIWNTYYTWKLGEK